MHMPVGKLEWPPGDAPGTVREGPLDLQDAAGLTGSLRTNVRLWTAELSNDQLLNSLVCVSPLAHLFYFLLKSYFKKVPAPARSSYRSRDGGREIDSAESVPGGAALKSCQGCRSRREGEGGGNKVNTGMGIRRQELILFHEKSTLSPLSVPPRIPQPRVSPGYFFLFLPPRLRISAMGFFLSPVEGALSYVAEGNLNNSILLPLFEGVGAVS